MKETKKSQILDLSVLCSQHSTCKLRMAAVQVYCIRTIERQCFNQRRSRTSLGFVASDIRLRINRITRGNPMLPYMDFF